LNARLGSIAAVLGSPSPLGLAPPGLLACQGLPVPARMGQAGYSLRIRACESCPATLSALLGRTAQLEAIELRAVQPDLTEALPRRSLHPTASHAMPEATAPLGRSRWASAPSVIIALMLLIHLNHAPPELTVLPQACLPSPHAPIVLLVELVSMFHCLRPMRFAPQATTARRSQQLLRRRRHCVPLGTTALLNLELLSHALPAGFSDQQGNLLVLHVLLGTSVLQMPRWFRSRACQGFTALKAPRARTRILALLAGTAHLWSFNLLLIARYVRQASTAAVLPQQVHLAGAVLGIIVCWGRRLPLRWMVIRAISVPRAGSVLRDPALRWPALQEPFPMPRG